MPRVIVCDVNETLLDVGALEPHFKQAFGDSRVLQDWFANVLLYSEVATLAGPYADFGSIGGAALDMVASARGIMLSAADRTRILQGMLTLPAHPDVRDGLQTMRDAGLRLVTLTNSAPAAVQQQLANAGLNAVLNGRSRWTQSVASSQPPRRTSRSLSRLHFRSIVYGSLPRTRGISSVPSVRGAPQPSSPDRGRSCIRSVRSRTSLARISAASRNRSLRRSLAKPDLSSTAVYGVARRRPAAESVFRLGRRFVGSVAFSSATRSPRDSHVRSAAAVRTPGGETYTNPLSGLPVKSICRTCLPRITTSNSLSGIRTIRSPPTMPQHIRPRHRNARPPNILRSVISLLVPNAWRTRFASCSSSAMGSCC